MPLTQGEDTRIRNSELWHRFRMLAQAVTPRLFAKVEGGYQVPNVIRERFRQSSGTQSGFENYYEPLWINLVRVNKDMIVSLPEYASVSEYITSDSTIRDYLLKHFPITADRLTEEAVRFYFHTPFIEAFLIEATAKSVGMGQPVAPEEDLLRLYLGLEADLYDQPTFWQALAPAIRLSADVDIIELSDRHRIRKLTEKDRTMWVNAIDAEGVGGSGIAKLMTTHALEVDQFLSQNPGSLIIEIEHLLTLLRLFRRGGMAVPAAIIGRPEDWQSNQWSVARVEITPAYRAGRSYHLWSADVEPLKRMWDWYALRAQQVPGTVGIALRRFNRARGDEPVEDRLIDTCVGLDALLGMGPNQELTYRICQRGSFLLGRNLAERTYVFDTLALAYRARGEIIHGGKVPAKAFADVLKRVGANRSAEDWGEDVTALLGAVIRAWLSFPKLVPSQTGAYSLSGTNVGKTLDANVTHCGELLRSHLGDWVHLPDLFRYDGGPWAPPTSEER